MGTAAGAGNSGVGKSAVMHQMLQQQSQADGLLATTLTFSAQTTSVATQDIIEAKLERRHRNRQDISVLKIGLLCCGLRLQLSQMQATNL